MFPNVHELTKSIQANTELMTKLLAEIQKLNSNTVKLTKAVESQNAWQQRDGLDRI
jgi:hypothetical protein